MVFPRRHLTSVRCDWCNRTRFRIIYICVNVLFDPQRGFAEARRSAWAFLSSANSLKSNRSMWMTGRRRRLTELLGIYQRLKACAYVPHRSANWTENEHLGLCPYSRKRKAESPRTTTPTLHLTAEGREVARQRSERSSHMANMNVKNAAKRDPGWVKPYDCGKPSNPSRPKDWGQSKITLENNATESARPRGRSNHCACPPGGSRELSVQKDPHLVGFAPSLNVLRFPDGSGTVWSHLVVHLRVKREAL
jgi:hypothetical protein